ncbi:UNVERIFIED_CONTAM: Survival of motor neuron-related-splicing factor 30 [Sesamum angustifolium]|uniref:Survival of motor neuron-related-splicing factor 30 n=1 Tax=Sesamum angustifolium TaxID=2727405 RepID=A0AAW2NX78_9LAMI
MESGEGEEVNIEELVANLSTYKDQLQQVRKLLNDDPKNSEFLDMEKELVEVIQLTEELLATAKQSDSGSGLGTGTSGEASPSPHLSGSSFHVKSRAADDDGDKFSVGTKVQAVWSEDGEWYDATIEAHTPNGYYVSYDEWGNKEEVDPDNVRAIQEGTADPLLEAEKIAVATKKPLSVRLPKLPRKTFSPGLFHRNFKLIPMIPKMWYVWNYSSFYKKAAKRKKIHAFKSKMRMEAKEVTQNKRQNAWQQFQTTKGRAKKVGFFSGRKRESIFKSPDDPFGKVGVTGSGKGLTEFQKREKHLHLKGANMESVDD